MKPLDTRRGMESWGECRGASFRAIGAGIFAFLALGTALHAQQIYGGLEFPAGDRPYGAAAGDLNGDGRLDLVVANDNTTLVPGTISVLIADAAGGFETPVAYPSGDTPRRVALGDINNDGALDAVSVNFGSAPTYNGTVAIFLGNGTGVLVPTSTKAVGYGWQDIAIVDFNHDGNLDIVIVNANAYSIGVLLGFGTGGFLSPTTVGFTKPPQRIAIGDLNGDGKPDVAVSHMAPFESQPGSISAALGTGTGAFQAPVVSNLAMGVMATGIAIAELSGDGKADVAVGNQNPGTVSILLGSGTASFPNHTDYPADVNCWALAAADFDSDGNLDVVDGGPAASTPILFGIGGGQFALVKGSLAGSPRDLVTFDHDGDGKMDMVATQYWENAIYIAPNLGAGSFPGASPGVIVGITPAAIAAGDLDGDGNADFVIANNGSDNVTVVRGNATGSLGAASTFATAPGPFALVLADLDLDGNLDLATASKTTFGVSLLLGNGHGLFANYLTLPTPITASALAAADLNQDGRLDLVISAAAMNRIGVLLAKPTGGFAPCALVAIPSPAPSLAAADVDGDGAVDLSMPQIGTSSLALLLGNGSGGFAAPALVASPVELKHVAAGDVDQDGRVDLAGMAVFGESSIVFWNAGSAVFVVSQSIPNTSYSQTYSGMLADLNRDGMPDLVSIEHGPWTLAIAMNTGGGRFANPWLYNSASSFGAAGVAVGDWNRDGAPDLAIATQAFFMMPGALVLVSNILDVPTGTQLLGTGTPGCGGVLALQPSSPPHANNPVFGLSGTNGPASSLGLCLVTNQQITGGGDPFGLGATFYVDLLGSTLVIPREFPSDSAGTAFAPLPIPNDPALVGTVFYAQSLFVEPPGKACGASPAHVVTSEGIAITIAP